MDNGDVIRMLMEHKLIHVLGRKEILCRPLIYTPTKHFLEVFEPEGLKNLLRTCLPSNEIEDLS